MPGETNIPEDLIDLPEIAEQDLAELNVSTEEIEDRLRKELPNAKEITEKDKVHEEWYKEARQMTPENLPAFITKLTTEYIHDYGTICHACAAAAVAATWAIEHGPQGGITGFQASAIMWEYIRNWMHGGENKPLRLLDMEDLLYPQYYYKFNAISKSTWDHIQIVAKEKLEKVEIGDESAHPNVIAHWKSILEGRVPFGLVVTDEE